MQILVYTSNLWYFIGTRGARSFIVAVELNKSSNIHNIVNVSCRRNYSHNKIFLQAPRPLAGATTDCTWGNSAPIRSTTILEAGASRHHGQGCSQWGRKQGCSQWESFSIVWIIFFLVILSSSFFFQFPSHSAIDSYNIFASTLRADFFDQNVFCN